MIIIMKYHSKHFLYKEGTVSPYKSSKTIKGWILYDIGPFLYVASGIDGHFGVYFVEILKNTYADPFAEVVSKLEKLRL